ncbi:hypothetical protein [Sandaracinobacteroides hominis]|uniref:hypothetical protein n=1 Tax=Sandaracinobacteroides hominis TaxID=2780086 RepID=UPI0018F6F797|nr:hypothetical protein [Sandaracinobacteroides hominis]
MAALCLSLMASPLLAGWVRADSEHFRVFGDTSEDRVIERAAVLEDFHRLLVDVTGRNLPAGAPPLDVFLVDRISDATPWRKLAPNVAGFYRADNGRISAVALDRGPATGGDLGGQEILLHEYAHHFLLGSGRLGYPAWYVEGFAEYFATAGFSPDRIELGQVSSNRAAWLSKGNWLPLEQLLSNQTTGQAAGSGMFYAQSWLLTHYLFRSPGMREKLIAYLKATGAGDDPVAAFRAHIDPDLPGFQLKLRRYLETRATYSSFDRPAATRSGIRVTQLPPSSESLLLPMVALEHGIAPSAGPEALRDIRRLAAQEPPDDLSRRALALAELQYGNAATAAARLDALLATHPGDPDLLRWRATAARLAGGNAGAEQARGWLSKAYAAAPSDWRTLHAWARLYRPVDGPLPPQALEVLLRAHQLAPQVSEVVLDTAVALSYADRMDEAAAVLQPLAWSPHGGPAADVARQLLARALANDRPGLLKEVEEFRRQRSPVTTVVQSRN